jgi:PhoH-like ATPase
MKGALVKNYVLDTCVLVHSPEALFSFEDNNVYIPFVVLEELDNLKTRDGETGRNARHTTRNLDELRKLGSLARGVKLENGGTLFVIRKASGPGMPDLDMKKNDNKILATACVMQAIYPNSQTTLVTNDIALRIKADAVGMKAEHFGKKKVSREQMHSGITEVGVQSELFKEFKKNGHLKSEGNVPLLDNMYVRLIDEATDKVALARWNKRTGSFKKLIDARDGVFGIRPMSEEQHFAIDALLNEDIKLVTLIGKAGTGKTLLAVAAGLHKTVNEDTYHKLLVSRPVEPMGKDLGFLPGSVDEKLAPWMQPIHDNLEFLFDIHKKTTPKKKGKKGEASEPGMSQQSLFDQGILQVEALTYIRGRSIPEQYMIVDEAQNLTPHEIKTIITRAGEGTKIVLTGDTQQIDSPYLDEQSNGLAYCVERMKELGITAHVTLTKGERSELAEAGSQLL